MWTIFQITLSCPSLKLNLLISFPKGAGPYGWHVGLLLLRDRELEIKGFLQRHQAGIHFSSCGISCAVHSQARYHSGAHGGQASAHNNAK